MAGATGVAIWTNLPLAEVSAAEMKVTAVVTTPSRPAAKAMPGLRPLSPELPSGAPGMPTPMVGAAHRRHAVKEGGASARQDGELVRLEQVRSFRVGLRPVRPCRPDIELATESASVSAGPGSSPPASPTSTIVGVDPERSWRWNRSCPIAASPVARILLAGVASEPASTKAKRRTP